MSERLYLTASAAGSRLHLSPSKNTRWRLHRNTIQDAETKQFLQKSLTFGPTPYTWIYRDNLFHTTTHEYLAIDWTDTFFLTKRKERAARIHVEAGALVWIKSELRRELDRALSMHRSQIMESTQGCNVGILLAAGASTRFHAETPKQLFRLDGEPLCMKSLRILCAHLDKVILVTNPSCYEDIRNCVGKDRKVVLLRAPQGSRMDSVATALRYLESWSRTRTIQTIVLHDAARPFLKDHHIPRLLASIRTHAYSQYSLKLTNGLVKIDGHECVDRDAYLEICTPIAIRYSVCRPLWRHVAHEWLPVLQALNLPYQFLEGTLLDLRKITVIEDIPNR